jgi:glycosyltransferase involved in cell wall biosynthesis
LDPCPASLRIAVISTPHIKTPPRGYGGSEEVASGLAEELARRGHQVTLFATPDSRTAGELRTFPPALPTGPHGHAGYREILHMCHALAEGDFDLVLNHCLQAAPALALYRGGPALTTLHYHPPAVDYFPDLDYVAVSHRQAELARKSGLHVMGVAHNGIDPTPYHWQTPKEDYLLWIGRFHYYKGPDLAIEVAERLGARLLLAAPPPPQDQQEFFEERVRPRLRGRVEWIGGIEGEEKFRLFECARCTLFPLRWEEPFGLVMVESMAAGVPVVASRRGAAPEVIAHGQTGFLADDAAGMAAAVEQARALSPAACRRRVEERFTCRQMADAYLALYPREGSGAPGPGPV